MNHKCFTRILHMCDMTHLYVQLIATYCNELQRPATYCKTLPHTYNPRHGAYVYCVHCVCVCMCACGITVFSTAPGPTFYLECFEIVWQQQSLSNVFELCYKKFFEKKRFRDFCCNTLQDNAMQY